MTWATKEAFFKAKVPTEKMEVPNIGTIYVYGLTCGQKDEYQNATTRISGKDRHIRLVNARALLLTMVVHDQHGRLLFNDSDIGRIIQIPAQITGGGR